MDMSVGYRGPAQSPYVVYANADAKKMEQNVGAAHPASAAINAHRGYIPGHAQPMAVDPAQQYAQFYGLALARQPAPSAAPMAVHHQGTSYITAYPGLPPYSMGLAAPAPGMRPFGTVAYPGPYAVPVPAMTSPPAPQRSPYMGGLPSAPTPYTIISAFPAQRSNVQMHATNLHQALRASSDPMSAAPGDGPGPFVSPFQETQLAGRSVSDQMDRVTKPRVEALERQRSAVAAFEAISRNVERLASRGPTQEQDAPVISVHLSPAASPTGADKPATTSGSSPEGLPSIYKALSGPLPSTTLQPIRNSPSPNVPAAKPLEPAIDPGANISASLRGASTDLFPGARFPSADLLLPSAARADSGLTTDGTTICLSPAANQVAGIKGHPIPLVDTDPRFLALRGADPVLSVARGVSGLGDSSFATLLRWPSSQETISGRLPGRTASGGLDLLAETARRESEEALPSGLESLGPFWNEAGKMNNGILERSGRERTISGASSGSGTSFVGVPVPATAWSHPVSWPQAPSGPPASIWPAAGAPPDAVGPSAWPSGTAPLPPGWQMPGSANFPPMNVAPQFLWLDQVKPTTSGSCDVSQESAPVDYEAPHEVAPKSEPDLHVAPSPARRRGRPKTTHLLTPQLKQAKLERRRKSNREAARRCRAKKKRLAMIAKGLLPPDAPEFEVKMDSDPEDDGGSDGDDGLMDTAEDDKTQTPAPE